MAMYKMSRTGASSVAIDTIKQHITSVTGVE